MHIDFHTHGKLAKKLPFSECYTNWLFDQAHAAGLDAICLTEHFNTTAFTELYEYLSSISTPQGDTLVLANGLKVFPGMEIDIAESGHILVIGNLATISALHTILEPHSEKSTFLPFSKLMTRLEQHPVLIGAAHPFRNGGHISELPEEALRRLHFLDLNGKDFALAPEHTSTKTQALGEALEIPVLCGSDTHQALQYGCVLNHFESDCTTIESLRQAIQAQSFTTEFDPQAAFKVHAACMLKRALKEIHTLGGDYVAILSDMSDS